MNKKYNFIERPLYLKKIIPFIDKNLIKIITGRRRVGKSYLLFQIMHEIKSINPDAKIIYINKEDLSFKKIINYDDLYLYIKEKESKNRKNYIFIDEVQEILEFEKALRSLLTENNYDIYCTGSNANLLSSDLSTLLSGRSIEIQVHPLVYPEFLNFHNLGDTEQNFFNFLKYGGSPNLIHFNLEEEIAFDYLQNIFNTIIVKDVISKHSIRNISFLKNLCYYLADNTGSLVSAKKISDFLKSQNIKMSPNLVLEYLSFLEEAYFVTCIKRTDIQGKKIFEIGEKFYLEDTGMRHALIGYKPGDIAKNLESTVLHHLVAAGYEVKVGKSGEKEIDFVCKKRGELTYIQVCYILNNENTIQREFGNLLKIKNNYPKYVLSLDPETNSSYEGIQHKNIRQFCMDILK